MLAQLVIPCSGKGSRFLPVTTQPKFLIPIAGRPMIDWAIESMRMPERFERVILVVHQDQNLSQADFDYLRSILLRVGRDVHFCIQTSERKGAADTILQIAGELDPKKSVALWNCDQVVWDWNRQLNPDADGWVLVFRDPSRNPKWSFAEIRPDGWISKIKEKQPISEFATVGAYFYKRARDLVFALEEMVLQNDRTNGEFYVAPAYNYLIHIGRKIAPVEISPGEMEGVGTPEDCDSFCIRHNLPDWRRKGV